MECIAENNRIRNLTFEVNSRCNLKCKHCTLWKGPHSELSWVQIRDVLCSRVLWQRFSVSLTGGECFLHNELDKILGILSLMVVSKRINNISIITNGIFEKRIMSVLSEVRNVQRLISLYFSIDGIKTTHDSLRGMIGAFEKTISTLLKVRGNFPNLSLGIKFTANETNLRDLLKVYKLSSQLGVRFYPKVVEMGVRNYYHRNSENVERELGDDFFRRARAKFIRLREEEQKTAEGCKIVDMDFLQTIINYLSHKELCRGCLTPERSLFITSEGKVFPCLYAEPICNINLHGWQEKIYGKSHHKIIESGKNLSCVQCIAYHGYLQKHNYET